MRMRREGDAVGCRFFGSCVDVVAPPLPPRGGGEDAGASTGERRSCGEDEEDEVLFIFFGLD